MADDRDPIKQGEAGEFIGNPVDDAQQARDDTREQEDAMIQKQLEKARKEAENPEPDDVKETEDAINKSLFGK